jgi:small ligand-binding sensory domain FIST
MKFASALATATDWESAAEQLIHQTRDLTGLSGGDLGLLFFSQSFASSSIELTRSLRRELGLRHLIGCTGGGIIGLDQEIENAPAISLLVAQAPDVVLTPLRVTQEQVEEATSPDYWRFLLEVDPADEPSFVLLADPFSLQSATLAAMLGDSFPGRPILGGLASGGRQPGEHLLVVDDEEYSDGAVGIALSGKVRLETVVSQGCRPIGEPLIITRADKNILFEIAGRPPMQVLRDMVPQLPERDQQLARTALFLGRVINEYKEDYGRGDFLIRNLLGSDPQSGAVAVGDLLRTGQTVQFQVRDGISADEDIRLLLDKVRHAPGFKRPSGALMFSCLGRGEGMYGSQHHDVRVLKEMLGPVPTSGFFCNGEIGPVGGRVYVHGFTNVIGLFSEP